jgi:paraquat-inducible protein B
MAIGKSTVVGAFVLGALGIGVAALLLFGGGRLLTKKLRVVAYFQNSVAGLAVGAPVTLRGVKIGTVQNMKVYLKLPELVPVIPVYMDIDPNQVSWTKDSLSAGEAELDLAVRAGLRAQLETQSLVTGQVSINLDFHPESPAKMAGTEGDVPEIPTMPSDMQHIKDEIADLKLPEIAEKARTALAGINSVIGELNGKVGPIADSLRQTSDSVRNTADTATEAVKQLQTDASKALDSINHLATHTDTQVATAGKEITQVADRVDKVVDNLNDLTSARAPLRGDLEAAVRDLAASASSLRDFTRNLERSPASTLLGTSK